MGARRAYARVEMTRSEAESNAARLNRDRPADGPWAPRPRPAGEWEVVRLVIPGLDRTRPTAAHVESRPRPSEPPDPRPAPLRNVPPFAG